MGIFLYRKSDCSHQSEPEVIVNMLSISCAGWREGAIVSYNPAGNGKEDHRCHGVENTLCRTYACCLPL